MPGNEGMKEPGQYGGNGGSMKGSSIHNGGGYISPPGGNGGSMKGSSILYCHPEHAKD